MNPYKRGEIWAQAHEGQCRTPRNDRGRDRSDKSIRRLLRHVTSGLLVSITVTEHIPVAFKPSRLWALLHAPQENNTMT